MRKVNPWNWFTKKRGPGYPRTIFINEPLPDDYYDKKGRVLKNKSFCSNQNITSKYTIITFVPRNLLEQFRRVANIFFLFIAILQFFPKFSTISPGLVILPLIVVLAITMLKDGYEDIKRHQSDHKVNHSVVHVLGGGGYVNPNPTKPKSKTFVRGIPLPHRRSKKKAAAEKEARKSLNLDPERAASPPPRMSHEEIRRVQSHVSNWDDDPEAGDSPKELGWQRTIWEDVKVGDIVKIYDNEQIPAGKSPCTGRPGPARRSAPEVNCLLTSFQTLSFARPLRRKMFVSSKRRTSTERRTSSPAMQSPVLRSWTMSNPRRRRTSTSTWMRPRSTCTV
jgi:phospholipid-translocating ATPase